MNIKLVLLIDFSIEDIDHIEMFVSDREKAAKWYKEIFGLKLIKKLDVWAKIGPLFIGTEDRSVTLALMNGKKDTEIKVDWDQVEKISITQDL